MGCRVTTFRGGKVEIRWDLLFWASLILYIFCCVSYRLGASINAAIGKWLDGGVFSVVPNIIVKKPIVGMLPLVKLFQMVAVEFILLLITTYVMYMSSNSRIPKFKLILFSIVFDYINIDQSFLVKFTHKNE